MVPLLLAIRSRASILYSFPCLVSEAIGWDDDSLVGDEDLEPAHDLSHGNTPVVLPVADSLCGLDEDDIVVLLALDVDLDLGSVSAHVVECVASRGVALVVVVEQLVLTLFSSLLLVVFKDESES